jgi:hypothetical protein
VLNWQGASIDNVAAFNFQGNGAYVDGLTASSFLDYAENISFNKFYSTYNGGAGLQVGSTLAVNNLESTSINNSVIETNGGAGISLAGANIQGFSGTNNTMQWDNFNAPGNELNVSGTAIGVDWAGNYMEVNQNHGSQDAKPYNLTAGLIGAKLGPNYVNIGGTATFPAQLYSAAGTALPSCSATSSQTYHMQACVSDSTGCTSGTTYASGSTTTCALQCNGTGWIETGSSVGCY